MKALPLLGSPFLAAALAAQAPLPPAPPAPTVPQSKGKADPAFQGEAYRLMREVEAHGEAHANLERLCDDIGPRPTGSEGLARATAWLKARLQAAGVERVWEEAWALPATWTRGTESAHLRTGSRQALRVAQLAYTPGTGGMVTAEVTVVGGATLQALEGSLAAARGKIALKGDTPKPPAGMDAAAFTRRVRALWEAAGVKALLLPSPLPGTMLQTVGTPVPDAHQWTPGFPAAYLGREHANLLRRLYSRGERVTLDLELGGTHLPGPIPAANLVAEIPGQEKADEVVLLGAHLDSVDLAQGASDNGAGVVAVLEVLRSVQALKLKPSRTLRAVFFTGEELESLGSKAYVKQHARELGQVQAVLVLDKGAGRLVGWPTMGEEAWVTPLAQAMAPAYTVGCTELVPGVIRQSDHEPFFDAGIPAFFAIQEPQDYWTVYHSDLDTLDHVSAPSLQQCCQALAATAWGFLQLPGRVPHRKP